MGVLAVRSRFVVASFSAVVALLGCLDVSIPAGAVFERPSDGDAAAPEDASSSTVDADAGDAGTASNVCGITRSSVGNARGVGKYCTKKGYQCLNPSFCIADYTADVEGFCSLTCANDATCGPDAFCWQPPSSTVMLCVPKACVGDAGASN